jgi:hypothetical protein
VIACEIQDISKDLKDIQKSGERYGFNAIEQGGPVVTLEVIHGLTLEWHPFSLRKLRLWALSLPRQIDKVVGRRTI